MIPRGGDEIAGGTVSGTGEELNRVPAPIKRERRNLREFLQPNFVGKRAEKFRGSSGARSEACILNFG